MEKYKSDAEFLLQMLSTSFCFKTEKTVGSLWLAKSSSVLQISGEPLSSLTGPKPLSTPRPRMLTAILYVQNSHILTSSNNCQESVAPWYTTPHSHSAPYGSLLSSHAVESTSEQDIMVRYGKQRHYAGSKGASAIFSCQRKIFWRISSKLRQSIQVNRVREGAFQEELISQV